MSRGVDRQYYAAVAESATSAGVAKCGEAGRSPRNRQLGLRVEKMQPAGLGGDAYLVTARDFGLRGHAGNGDAGGADGGLEQDFRAELFDDFDAGIEVQARR